MIYVIIAVVIVYALNVFMYEKYIERQKRTINLLEQSKINAEDRVDLLEQLNEAAENEIEAMRGQIRKAAAKTETMKLGDAIQKIREQEND